MNSFDFIQCEEDPQYEHYNYMLQLQEEEEYRALQDQEFCDFVNDLILEIIQ